MKTDLLKPRSNPELRINLKLHGRIAQIVKDKMLHLDIDAPTAIRILIAEAVEGKVAAQSLTPPRP